MATTLRDLLIQRAARLQDRPALTAPDWGTLSYAQLRNRVEGVALGLLAEPPCPTVFCTTGTAWDWIAELAAAASGLIWDPSGQPLALPILGGPRFNHEDGRGPYHAREACVGADTPFGSALTHGELLLRLRRINGRLGWDHTTVLTLPLARLPEAPLRAALWSALYAGAQVILESEATAPPSLLSRFRKAAPVWDDAPFREFWISP